MFLFYRIFVKHFCICITPISSFSFSIRRSYVRANSIQCACIRKFHFRFSSRLLYITAVVSSIEMQAATTRNIMTNRPLIKTYTQFTLPIGFGRVCVRVWLLLIVYGVNWQLSCRTNRTKIEHGILKACALEDFRQ